MGSAQKNWGNRVIAIGIILIVAVLAVQVVSAHFATPKATLHIGGDKFIATIADTEASRIQGLSGTLHLGADHAMVLVFDADGRHGIWMKDMHYALDVLWLNESKQVVDYVTNVSPDSYPRVFTPKEDARYVVELKAGTIKARGIRVGQVAVFSGTDKEL